MFIEGVELFGSDLFGIVPGDAAVMAPEQRHLLEVVFMTALGARWERAEMGLAGLTCNQDDLLMPDAAVVVE